MRSLSHFAADANAGPLSALFVDQNAINSWLVQYEHRLSVEDSSLVSQSMLRTNPKFVLRNHLGEMAIRQARDHDYSGVQTLLGLLENPFDEHLEHDSLAGLPPDWAASIAISCSS